jgi:hypothetical protein|tara:strand:+ start:3693 stop:3968 length:276 start_codon:yes stop_codon:yes gene_type:complete
MSWDDLEVDQDQAREAHSAIRERQIELAKAYHRCFSSDDGMKVIEEMTNRFLLENDTSLSAQNVNYESAYHNGEAGVMKYIVHQIQQAEKL